MGGWEADVRHLTLAVPPDEVSVEPRRFEFELRAPEDIAAGVPRLRGYALYYICEDISRELARNGGLRRYRAHHADRTAACASSAGKTSRSNSASRPPTGASRSNDDMTPRAVKPNRNSNHGRGCFVDQTAHITRSGIVPVLERPAHNGTYVAVLGLSSGSGHRVLLLIGPHDPFDPDRAPRVRDLPARSCDGK